MILNRYERMIARRYLLPGKGEGFIFLVAAISLAAVALGVAALIIVMSVMNGFRAELFDKIVGLNGQMPPAMKASMALDLDRGNRLELPWLSGKVVAMGRELGVPTPTHSMLYAMLKPYVMGTPG